MPVGQKTPCPISRETFRAKARPIVATINGVAVVLPPKEFSTGSIGWFNNEKMAVEIDGVLCRVQLNVNLTIANSKELPQ